MTEVWTMDNKIKFDPADVKRWEIYKPGSTDHYKRGTRLTRWQVVAMFDEETPIIYVGYYGSEEEAVKAVDALDAMGKDQVMPKVWNWNNIHKFDPADVARWTIREPGEKDYYREGDPLLTRWQVYALFKELPSINVGYYDTHEEAVKVVDELDAMKKGNMPDIDAELVEQEIKE